MQPENLVVEYLPGSYIYLWLDPVKIGEDLNDKDTVWFVDYNWRQVQLIKLSLTLSFTHSCIHVHAHSHYMIYFSWIYVLAVTLLSTFDLLLPLNQAYLFMLSV